jgi:hypothetical protein
MPFVGKLIKQFLPIVVIFGIRYLPFNEEENLFVGRVLYGLKVAITLIVAAIVYMKISSVQHKPTDVVKEHEDNGEVVPEMPISAYDKIHVKKFLKSQVMSTLITLGIHYKFNFVQPLYIQFVMSMIALYDWNLFQIYILNKTAADDKALKRPFESAQKAPGFMESMNKKLQEANEDANKKQK